MTRAPPCVSPWAQAKAKFWTRCNRLNKAARRAHHTNRGNHSIWRTADATPAHASCLCGWIAASVTRCRHALRHTGLNLVVGNCDMILRVGGANFIRGELYQCVSLGEQLHRRGKKPAECGVTMSFSHCAAPLSNLHSPTARPMQRLAT